MGLHPYEYHVVLISGTYNVWVLFIKNKAINDVILCHDVTMSRFIVYVGN